MFAQRQRSHTTVMHAIKQTIARLGTDPEAFAAVQELTARLTDQRDELCKRLGLLAHGDEL